MKPISAASVDLSAAVARVHRAPQVDPELLLYAGDSPERESFFDHDDAHVPVVLDSKPVYVTLTKKATLPDYLDQKGRRVHRTVFTIPPKVRENVARAFGVDTSDDVAVTTALIALADYAAMALRRDGKRLVVHGAPDAKRLDRRKARRMVKPAR
jgi:hypothetical protein